MILFEICRSRLRSVTSFGEPKFLYQSSNLSNRSLIFGWAMGQLNYCSIMFGAIVGSEGVTGAGRSRARNAAVVATIASTHTNRCMRA